MMTSQTLRAARRHRDLATTETMPTWVRLSPLNETQGPVSEQRLVLVIDAQLIARRILELEFPTPAE